MYKRRHSIVMMTAVAVSMLFSLTSLFGLAGLAAPSATAQGKGKPVPNPKVSVTILNGLDVSADRVYAGTGEPVPYVDGVDGAEAQIWAGGSEDMTLRLYVSTRKFNVRHLFIDCGSSACTPVADGTYTNGWFINIRQIGTMAVGETKWTRAHVMVTPSNKTSTSFNWCGDINFDPSSFGVTLLQTTTTCSGSNYLVSVFRSSSTDWTVSTSDPRDSGLLHIAPISGLLQNLTRGTLWNGIYQTSFQLHIRLLP